MAVTASFQPGTGTLTAFGDALDNSLTLSRNAAGQILVNGGAVAVAGGTPTVANTTLIQAFGLDGADTIAMNEANGALPNANLFGGIGNDTVTGGSGGDQLFGQADNDTLLGKGGNDFLFGGAGNDVLTGGDADDQMFGEAGDDRMIWNPGDDSDLMEGGADTDTAQVNGGNGGEVFAVTANGDRVRFDRVTPAPFSLDIGTTENLVVAMNGGDDTFSATGNLAALISITVDGGAGKDTIGGGNGADLLIGGADDDFIDGNQGNDTAFLGEGNDVFQWDPGDGSDVVEGQGGSDTLIFNGSNIAEQINVSANGSRVLFTRDVANIAMDLNDVETVRFQALGGADTITVADLTGTDVKEVDVDLAATPGGSTSDGAIDQVIVNATSVANAITLLSTGNTVTIGGVPATVVVSNIDAGMDRITVKALDGDDAINALPVSNITLLTLDGGQGNDAILGSAGADTILGGEGSDVLTGGGGADAVAGEAGNDLLVWNPGDGNDTLEGGADSDTVLVNGSAGADTFIVSANGPRVQVNQTIPATVSLDIGATEVVVFSLGAGGDTFSAGDGLAALTQLVVDGGLGKDTITGGDGTDQLFGSEGSDLITGGRGNDVAFLGADDDVFVWNPGDGSDVVEGQGGSDTLQFNGANIAEKITIAANGGHVGFFRDVANIAMSLGGTETIAFKALGGADTITVGDLSGTEASTVAIDLGSGTGGGDGAFDRVLVNGTAGANAITVSGAGTSVSVSGLPGTVTIAQAEATDQLIVSGGAGVDTIVASGLPAGIVQLTLDGGEGGDVLVGSQGVDVLLGGAGDDVVLGGQGDDIAFLGEGNDVFQWNPGDGRDIVEGEGGTDLMRFNGSAGAETITLSANGARGSLTRDVGSITMDFASMETVDIQAGAGADAVVINNLAGTGIANVQVGLASPNTVGDGQVDRVTVNGTGGADRFDLASNAGGVVVAAPGTLIAITQTEAGDQLMIEGGGGADILNATGVAAGKVALTLSGGDGADQVFGSAGGDVIKGGTGGDALFGLGGSDTFAFASVAESNLTTGYDTIGDFQTGVDRLDLSAFHAQPGQVSIVSDATSTALYLDTDGATPGFEVAIAFTGANAIHLSDIVF